MLTLLIVVLLGFSTANGVGTPRMDLSRVPFSITEREEVESLIAQEKVMVFSKSQCPYSKRAKELLKKCNVAFKALEIDLTSSPDYMIHTQAVLYALTKQSTVPNIFIGGVHIGGYKNIRQLQDTGELGAILNATGVANSLTPPAEGQI